MPCFKYSCLLILQLLVYLINDLSLHVDRIVAMNLPKFISLFSFWLIINSLELELMEQRQNQTQLETCGLKGGWSI